MEKKTEIKKVVNLAHLRYAALVCCSDTHVYIFRRPRCNQAAQRPRKQWQEPPLGERL